MGKEEKIRKKAEVLLTKAEHYMDTEQYKRSAEAFHKSGDLYFDELSEWKISERCFFYASKNYYKLGGQRNYHRASILQQKGANCSILFRNYSKARDYFDISAKSILKSEAKTKDEIATANVCFAFMCYFVQGLQDEAILSIKRFQTQIDPDIFNDHHILMKLIHNLSNAILNHNAKYLRAISKDFLLDKYSNAEKDLIRSAFLVAYSTLKTKYELNLEQDEFERDKIIELSTQFICDNIKEIENDKKFASTINSISITNIEFDLSDNLSLKEKPELPLKINLSNSGAQALPLKFRTNFPGRGHIGPIKLSFNINGFFQYYAISEKQDLTITSPAAILGINLKPQKTPVINQSFPLEIIVSNTSDGDAMEIDIEFEFPDEIRMMRGTFKKKIYAISQNEHFKWQIILKASDVGEIPIKSIVSFKDGDGNMRGPFEAIFPLQINL